MTEKNLKLKLLQDTFGVCKLNSSLDIPQWPYQSEFFSITKTSDELSIVCSETVIPADVHCEKGWRAFKIAGILDFSLIGILSLLSSALAKAGISIFAISTYNTDYILVKAVDLESAIKTLLKEGYIIDDKPALAATAESISQSRMIIITKENPKSPEATLLMNELSEALEAITGDSGKNSFDPNDVCIPRSLFVIARTLNGEQAIGCGAIRPLNKNIAELKRMYTKTKALGNGTKILAYLEEQAQNFGYTALWLETRIVNQRAVSFYESRGYHQIPNYGNYINNPQSVCFEKLLT